MTEQLAQPVDRAFGKWVLAFPHRTGLVARTALTLAAIINCAIFVWICSMFDLPQLRGFDGSLVHQPSAPAALLVVAVLLLGTTLVGTVIAGAIHFEAGLFAAAIGLMTLSERCGTMQSVLLEAGGNASVYIGLITELVILGVLLVAAWFMLRAVDKGLHGAAELPAGEPQTPMQRLTATVAQTAITAAGVMILCQSEAKNQCLAAVGIASLLGSVLAYKYAPTRPSIWFWIGPLIVGVVGYAIAAMGYDDHLNIGIPTGFFAPLARPLPLDYASFGVAGGILGYWVMHKTSGEEGD
jgi:hypothetical protein